MSIKKLFFVALFVRVTSGRLERIVLSVTMLRFHYYYYYYYYHYLLVLLLTCYLYTCDVGIPQLICHIFAPRTATFHTFA
jgi:hypothetical protein